MASITHRQWETGSAWRAKVESRGRVITRTFATKREAQEWAKHVERELASTGTTGEGERKTLAAAIEAYSEGRLPELKSATDRARQLEWWNQKLGHRLVADVVRQPVLISNELQAMSGTWAPSTFNGYRSALSAVFRYVREELHWISHNPCSDIPRKRPRNDDRAQPITAEQFRSCLAACEGVERRLHMRALLLVLGTTGCRRGEAMKATWEDYDLEAGVLRIRTPKNDEQRVVALHPEALKALDALPRRAARPFANFGNPHKLWDPYPTWRQVRSAAGLSERVRLHDLRHSFGVWSIEAGVGLRELQAVFGHSIPQMTARYSRLSAQHNRSAQAKVFDQLGELGDD